MMHAHARTLMSYWDSRRRDDAVPERADIAASDLRELLGNLFMLQRHDAFHHVFRLAGTKLCELHQRELRDQNFLSFWRGYDREQVRLLLESGADSDLTTEAAAKEPPEKLQRTLGKLGQQES